MSCCSGSNNFNRNELERAVRAAERAACMAERAEKAPVKHRRHFGKCAALLRKPATTPAAVSTTAAVSAGNRVFQSRHMAAYIEF